MPESRLLRIGSAWLTIRTRGRVTGEFTLLTLLEKKTDTPYTGFANAVPQIRFFYADERNSEGSIKGHALDGDAHAEFYAQLATGDKDVPWHATFVKGQGYTKF